MIRIVLLRLLESYFQHRWLYFVPLVLAIAAGGAFIATSPPEYVTYGNIYVEKDTLLASLTSNTTDGSWWVTAAQTTTNEVYELLATNAFVRSAIAKTKLEANMSGGQEAIDETMRYFRNAISIRPNGDKLVSIAATSDDPELAQQMVQSLMEAYVQWRLNNDYRESVVAQEFFAGQIDPYRQDVDQARDDLIVYLNANPAPARGDRPPEQEFEVLRLQSELEQAQARLSNALSNEESARLALVQSESVTRQTYLVIDDPFLPNESEFSIRGVVRDMIIFVAAGVFLMLAGIVATALLDRSLRFPIDVRHGLSLPVLAMLPTARQLASVNLVSAAVADDLEPSSATQSGDSATLQPQL